MSAAYDEHASSDPKGHAVAPFIAALVGDIGRPVSNVPVATDLKHLPGESGLWAGIQNIIRLQIYGSTHLLAQVRRYGRVYRHVLGSHPVVVVADPAMIASIARNEDRAWSSSLAYHVLFGGLDTSSTTLDSLVGLDFERHREARRLVQPAFTPNALAGYLDTAVTKFDHATDRWLQHDRIGFKQAIRELFTNVSSTIFMGERDPAETMALDRALKDVWEAPFSLIRHPVLGRKWRKGTLGFRVLHRALRAQIAQRRESNDTDLFSRLCQSGREDVEWLDDATLVRLFIGIMAGAFETTSLGVTSMAYLLAKHPEWQERLRAESAAIGSGPLDYEATKRLEQNEWCWKETLRLFPVALMFPRRALRDVELGNLRVPAGTQVMSLTGAALMDPAWWDNPERFDPERFSPARAEDKQQRSAYLPFGSGAHTCIGMQLANLKAKAFWHVLLSKCRIRLASDRPVRHETRPFGAVSGPVELVLERI